MKKYKHKLTGLIANQLKEMDFMYILQNEPCGIKEAYIPAKVIENSNDWEEVKWHPKIISFKNICSDTILTYEEGINRFNSGASDIIIYQVATSPTEIWTVGDKVKCKNPESHLHKTQEIIGFFLNGLTPDDTRNICVKTNLTNKNGLNLNNIEKASEPLFVTEDGKEIFEWNEFYYIGDDGNLRLTKCLYKGDGNFSKYKTFSTKEAAEKYIKKNKPRFSEQQLLDLINETDFSSSAEEEWFRKRLDI